MNIFRLMNQKPKKLTMPNSSFPTFELIESYGHEQVVFCSNKELGLKAIIGIQDKNMSIGIIKKYNGGDI